MSFMEITSSDNWFKKHPEKIAGKEVETGFSQFPIKVIGTKEDVLRVTGFKAPDQDKEDRERRKRKAQAKLKLAKAKLILMRSKE